MVTIDLYIKHKIVLYLYNFIRLDIFGMESLPWEITQDGIATALYISRAHACVELKKMKEQGLVVESTGHIIGSRYRRKVFKLTDLGADEYEDITYRARRDGMDLSNYNEDRIRSEGVNMSDATKEDFFVLGCASVLRIPVNRDLLPECTNISLPFDRRNRCMIRPRAREEILAQATDEQMVSWHSFAADLWLDRAEDMEDSLTAIHERLYHLTKAGRTIDACRLISNNTYDILQTVNDDLHDSMLMLDPIPERYLSEVLPVRIEVDSECMDLADMEVCIERLDTIDPGLSVIYRADLEHLRGDDDTALQMLRSSEVDEQLAKIRIARILIDKGDLVGARRALDSIREIASSRNTSVGVDRFILLARIDKLEGRDSDAYARLMKARASVGDKGKKRIDSILSSMDLRM